jgi:hypothetical protein
MDAIFALMAIVGSKDNRYAFFIVMTSYDTVGPNRTFNWRYLDS